MACIFYYFHVKACLLSIIIVIFALYKNNTGKIMLFTESTFVKTIEVLREQHEIDLSYSVLMEKSLGAENVPPYDNTRLVNQLFLLLQEQFPPKNGVCEIERYCWELGFGIVDGKQVISPSDLYFVLLKSEKL
jgi:hypothetical protein